MGLFKFFCNNHVDECNRGAKYSAFMRKKLDPMSKVFHTVSILENLVRKISWPIHLPEMKFIEMSKSVKSFVWYFNLKFIKRPELKFYDSYMAPDSRSCPIETLYFSLICTPPVF